MSYFVLCEDAQEACRDLSFATLCAGELLAVDEDRLVVIEGDGGRWRAALVGDDVRLHRLYSDGIPLKPAAEYEAERLHGYARQIDKQERRRAAKKKDRDRDAERQRRERSDKFCQGIRRGVVCIDEARPFAQVVDAAKWVGVNQHSTLVVAIRRGRKCGGLRWQYADVLLKELGHGSGRSRSADGSAAQAVEAQAFRPNRAALVEAAQQALLLSKRAQVQALSRKQPPAGVGQQAASQVG